MASLVALPVDSRLRIGGLFLPDTWAGLGVVGAFTMSNFGLFPHGDSFGVAVTTPNAEGYPVVVALSQAWPDKADAVVGSDYVAINPGQTVTLASGQYVGLVMRTTTLPTQYAGRSLTFMVAEYSAVTGLSIGSIVPYPVSSWLSATFTAKPLSSTVTVSPSGTVTAALPTPLPPSSTSPASTPSGGSGASSQTGGQPQTGTSPLASPTGATTSPPSFWASLSTTEKALAIGTGTALAAGGAVLAFSAGGRDR